MHAHYLYDAAGQRVKKLVRTPGRRRSRSPTTWAGSSTTAGDRRRTRREQPRPRHATTSSASPSSGWDRHTPTTAAPPCSTTSATTSAAATSSSTTAGTQTNREEYTPYGETSFGSYARKRYRFTGQERDEESGLAYHGARYLQPTLGRFTSVDPAHESYPGWSPFCYAVGNPLRFTDRTGMSPSDAETKSGGKVAAAKPQRRMSTR